MVFMNSLISTFFLVLPVSDIDSSDLLVIEAALKQKIP